MTILQVAFIVACIYFVVSVFAYSWAHPDMTDMRKFLNTWDALTWDWEAPDAE